MEAGNPAAHSCRRCDVRELIRRLWREEQGQDLTEYALLMVLVALAALTSMKTLANTVSNVFSNAASTFASVAT
ncbi:MAG: Flp family type IVb pilin [Acidobacteria bacterium]|nr:Flp family type IVb pilin [Acidobacteriota bacterium]